MLFWKMEGHILVDLLPRLYREANVPYTPSKTLIEDTLNIYYCSYMDKPIKSREISSCLENYRTAFTLLSITTVISMEIYYPDAVKGSWVRSSMLHITGNYPEIQAVNTERTSVDSNLITQWIRMGSSNQESLPDLKFMYTLFKRRESLIKINKRYAVEKALQYYNLLLRLSDTDGKGYLMLSAQCVGLGKKYPVWNAGIDLNEANTQMILTINKWFTKKLT